eukprot:SAG11_NODE_394_length_9826_cov_3.333607_7_plen_153_part_00
MCIISSEQNCVVTTTYLSTKITTKRFKKIQLVTPTKQKQNVNAPLVPIFSISYTIPLMPWPVHIFVRRFIELTKLSKLSVSVTCRSTNFNRRRNHFLTDQCAVDGEKLQNSQTRRDHEDQTNSLPALRKQRGSTAPNQRRLCTVELIVVELG